MIELSNQAKDFKLGLYCHYKGPLYEALGIVNHSETLEEMVSYKKLEDGSYWVRPLKMFLEEVEVDGIKKPRFEYLGVSSK
jgi:hypothetical protein